MRPGKGSYRLRFLPSLRSLSRFSLAPWHGDERCRDCTLALHRGMRRRMMHVWLGVWIPRAVSSPDADISAGWYTWSRHRTNLPLRDEKKNMFVQMTPILWAKMSVHLS